MTSYTALERLTKIKVNKLIKTIDKSSSKIRKSNISNPIFFDLEILSIIVIYNELNKEMGKRLPKKIKEAFYRFVSEFRRFEKEYNELREEDINFAKAA